MGHPRELPMVRVQHETPGRMDSGGQPESLRVGADGDSARYPASAHDGA